MFFYFKRIYTKNGKVIDLYHQSEKYTYILPQEGSLERNLLEKFCKKHHLNILSKYEVGSLNVRKDLVKSGIRYIFWN